MSLAPFALIFNIQIKLRNWCPFVLIFTCACLNSSCLWLPLASATLAFAQRAKGKQGKQQGKKKYQIG
jgi:hypothetical protein